MMQKFKLMTERKLFIRIRMERFGDFFYQESESEIREPLRNLNVLFQDFANPL